MNANSKRQENRWTVYEYMKKRFMETGFIPPLRNVVTHFSHLPAEELREGIIEFQMTIPQFKKIYDRQEQEKMGA
jgi:hypothetical protein